MMSLLMLLFCLFNATVLAEISSSPITALPNRGVQPVPNCNADFNDLEKSQIIQGFRDAQDLAAAAYEASSNDNPIYLNYFPKTVKWTASNPAEVVREVFKRIWVGQLNGCGKTLQDVLFSKDYDTIEYGYVCNEATDFGETIGWEDEDPIIILCPSAFAHGAIGRRPDGFPAAPAAVTCDTIGDQTSWRMSTLGLTILHEWTHIDFLTADALASTHRPAEGTDDELEEGSGDIYGCVEAQDIAANQDAIYIAENYVWFATEAFWSKQCGKTFRNPGSESDKDPLFAGQSGVEAHPIWER